MAVNASDTVDDIRESGAVEGAGRAGLAARGAMYVVSAALTAQIALSTTSSEGPGNQGALNAVAQHNFGRVVLVVFAVGLAGYALWRFVAAATYRAGEDDTAIKAWAKRVGYVGRGLIYVVAFVTAVMLILSGDDGGGSGGGGQTTARVFDWPFGRWIVLGVGVGFLVAAGFNAYRAVSSDYKQKWSDDMTGAQRRWATRVSAAGLIGHTGVFALTGFFLVKAAIQVDSSEPEGLDESIRALAEASGGQLYLLIMAAAMLAYAGFSFVEARWRKVLE